MMKGIQKYPVVFCHLEYCLCHEYGEGNAIHTTLSNTYKIAQSVAFKTR